MAVTNTETRVIYRGNGVATKFAIPFSFLRPEHLRVVRIDITGREILLTSDYFVDMVSLAVIFPGYPSGQEPPENERPAKLQEGDLLLIYRVTPRTQEIDLPGQEILQEIERMADRTILIVQEQEEIVTKALETSEEAKEFAAGSAGSAAYYAEQARLSKDSASSSALSASNSAFLAQAARSSAMEYASISESSMHDSVEAMLLAENYKESAFGSKTAAESAAASALVSKESALSSASISLGGANRAEAAADRAEAATGGVTSLNGLSGSVNLAVTGGSISKNNNTIMITVDNSEGVGGVSSVNGQAGDVQLTYLEVGAASAVHLHSVEDIKNLGTALDIMQEAINGKASVTHTHTIAQVGALQSTLTNMQTAIDSKMNKDSLFSGNAIVFPDGSKFGIG